MKVQIILCALLGVILLAACAAPVTVAPTSAPAAPKPTDAPKATAAPVNTPAPAPTAAPTTDPNAAKKGGKVIIGTPQEPKMLNPLLSSATIEDIVEGMTIEGLVKIDADGKYAPALAEALPTVEKDGKQITYKLRKGVKFSNGDPFTCADVKFTKDARLSKLSQASTSGYKDIDKLECPDDYTVVVTFTQVFAPYLSLFSSLIPKSVGDLAKMDSWEFNRKPVGTGPWVLSEWKSGDYIAFVPNKNYREAGKPYLDTVIFKVLPSRETGMQLLGTGEIDVLWNLIESDFPALKQLASKGVGYAGVPTGENEMLVLNFGDPKVDAPEDIKKNPHPILADLRVRQAIQMGIDKKLIVDTLLYGNVKVGTTVLPIGQFACPQPPSKFDPKGAAALLDEAGWKLGADGIRVKDGVRMSMKIQTTSGDKLREDAEQAFVKMMKDIGIEFKIDNVPSDVLFAGWDSKGLRKHGTFDVVMYTTGTSIDPDSHLFGNYHSARIPIAANKGAGSNYSRYSNKDVDTAIDKAAGVADVKTRQELYCKAATQINTDLPRIYLYERLSLSGYRTALQNFRVSPGADDIITGSENWWIKK